MKDDRPKQQKEQDKKMRELRRYQRGRKLEYHPQYRERVLCLAGLAEMVRLNQEMGFYDSDKAGSKPREEDKRV
jgi:hypothetical protein